MKKGLELRRKIAKKHIGGRLLIQLRIFIAISLVMFGIVGWDIYQNVINPLLALLGVAVGISVGLIVGHLSVVKWHEDTQTVITGMDKMGALSIVIYIGFSLFRTRIFGHFIHGPALLAFTFSTVGAIMLGRILSQGRNIQKILREQKKI